ncbi:MAG: GNAT family N-acetyltransferase [Acidobacteria bacterium 13_1_20CM_3_53_8]|nr:MAG: GNAT family N-acetyltransferase [Acidobacteria bacterium 13_1_20CM_3_53_8]
MKELQTSRLRLRLFTMEDLEALAKIVSDTEVMKYIGVGGARDLLSAEKTIKTILSHWEKHGFGIWALEEKATGNLIGWCGLQHLDKTPEVEIAYLLDSPYWRQGFATEAARAVLAYGFEHLGLDRIVAVARPENIGSYRVMEKVGMEYERETHFYGVDVVYYAIKREGFSEVPRVDS